MPADRSTPPALLLAGILMVLPAAGFAAADPPETCPTPIFADWSLLSLAFEDGTPCEEQAPFEYTPCEDYTLIPHPGGAHGYGATHPYTTCLYDRVTAAGAPRGVMIRNRNCPFPYDFEPYTPAPSTIDDVLVYVPDMEFVFMDLEGDILGEVEPNVLEVVARTQAVNPSARIGNYAFYPGPYDGSFPYESQADRANHPSGADLDALYLSSGVDIAMPNCYPYEYYVRHTVTGQYGGSSPNARSALFWAPLERLSVAKRDLPAGHMLMPWIAPFIAWDGYEAPEPTLEDVAALTQHFRLRGADAFYAFSPGASGHPLFDAESYRQFALASWLALDDALVSTTPPVVLNVETNKTEGVEWSGLQTGDRVVILASNLGSDDPAVITLPDITGVPATISVPLGSHVLFEFDVSVCAADLDGDDTVSFTDLLTVLSSWGPCSGIPCAADLDGDGQVEFQDLLTVLSNWGPCP